MKVDKASLLKILAGIVCSVCGGPKNPQVWTCSGCYKPHQNSAEHQALSDRCDVHMEAAHAFLELAKSTRVKPS